MMTSNPAGGIVQLLESQIIECDSTQSELGEQRERNHRYYAMQPLGNEIPGRSAYVDPAVLDTVEGKKAYFKETFFSGRRVAKFKPSNGEPGELADLKTAYVENQFERTAFYKTFRDGLHDAFVAKRMALFVEWEDKEKTLITELKGADPQIVKFMVSQTDDLVGVDDSELEMGEDGVTGTLRVITDDSSVRIKLIQPERYYRDPHATYPEDAAYCSFEEESTRGELINEGFSREQVETLKVDYRFRREEEDNARKSHDSSWSHRRKHKRSAEQEIITTFYTFTWSNLSTEFEDYPDETRLYKIRWSLGEVLMYEDGEPAIQEVDEMPFLEWTPYKISHAESGLCDADIVAHNQKTQSTLKRLVIDNQQMRNLSRWEAVANNVKNPRELLDPNIGGVLWTKQIGSVTPLPAPELSPLTMSVIEMMETDKENRTGLSRLAKGMNKDAMSEQNAQGMIEKLTQSSNRRVMAEVRDYAQTLYVPLMQMVYRLGARNDSKVYQLEAAGNQYQVQPDMWPDVIPGASVHPALTPEQGMQYAQGLMMMDQKLSNDPLLSPLYGVQQRHALADDVFDAIGVMDTSRYMVRPGSPEHNDIMQQQQQSQQAEMQQQQQQQDLQTKLALSADEREWFGYQNLGLKTQVEATDKATDNAREDRRLRHTKVVDFRELQLKEKEIGLKVQR